MFQEGILSVTVTEEINNSQHKDLKNVGLCLVHCMCLHIFPKYVYS